MISANPHSYQLAGIILIIEGLLLTLYSSKAEYGWKMFGWAEDEEDEFYTWLDNLPGIVSMGYVVAGFGLAMQKIDTDELAWGLMAIYLAGIGLQGFRENTEAPWRQVLVRLCNHIPIRIINGV